MLSQDGRNSQHFLLGLPSIAVECAAEDAVHVRAANWNAERISEFALGGLEA